MNNTLKNPNELKPADVEAHNRFDDDGNPWNPLDPEPEDTWRAWFDEKRAELRCRYIKATRTIEEKPVMSLAIALGAGYVLGRILAGRSES